MSKPIKIVELDFTTLQFFEKYVLSTIHEDMDIDMDMLKTLQFEIGNFYQDAFYGYISDRRNSYSINPLIYMDVGHSFVGMAVVCDTYLKEMNATFEKHFMARPFQIFNDMGLAKKWMGDLVGRTISKQAHL